MGGGEYVQTHITVTVYELFIVCLRLSVCGFVFSFFIFYLGGDALTGAVVE